MSSYQGELKQSTAKDVTILLISSTDHIAGKTGATLTIYASKNGAAHAAITPTVTELDSTNAPGVYKLAFTTTHTNTVGELQLHITATGADPADYKWNVSARILDDLAYPATSGRSIVVDANGLVDANTVKLGPTGSGTPQTARDIGASVLLSSGTGTGQLDFTSGVVKANLAQILGTALTETAGQIAAAFKQFFNIASPTSTMNVITTVTTTTTATNLTNAPTAGDFTATMKTSLNNATPSVTVSDKTGFSLSSAGVQAIWDALTSALTTVGSIGKLLVDNINATISSRLASASYTAPDNTSITAIKAKTDNLPVDPADASDIAAAFAVTDGLITTVDTVVDAIKVKTDSLTFTTAGHVDANVQQINDTELTGNGSTLNPWGPA